MLCAMAVSTYFTEELLSTRLGVFMESIKKLVSSNFPGPIYVVDDGSSVTEHLEYVRALRDDRIIIVLRDSNGGVSRTKNTCIRLLMESGAKFCFLADDDTDYRNPDWALRYIEAMVSTGCSHLSVMSRDIYPGVIEEIAQEPGIAGLDCEVVQVYLHNGFMLTFTPAIIEAHGYFDIFEGPMGHEHVHWTTKIMGGPTVYDRLDSDLLVGVLDVLGQGSTRGDSFWADNATHKEQAIGLYGRAECVEY